MLHSINTHGWTNKTAWCVPTMVSFQTGTPLIHSHSRAAMFMNEKLSKVSGVDLASMICMLGEQGYVAKQIDLIERYGTDARVTLEKYIGDLNGYERCMPQAVLVNSGKETHVVSTHMNHFADNWTMKIVTPKEFPHMKKNVLSSWIISKR